MLRLPVIPPLMMLVTAMLLAACKGPEQVGPSPILAVGHGGAGFDTYRSTIPPNTQAAVRQGLLVEGAGGVEIDIQLTADSVLVLHHDGSLDASTHCSGCIPFLRADELADCPIIPRNGPVQGRHPIPRLDSILDLYDDGQAIFFFNVKTFFACPFSPDEQEAYRARFARALAGLMTSRSLHGRAYVETFDMHMLAACRRADPAMPLILDEDNFDLALERVQSLGYQGIGIVNEAVDSLQVARAKEVGVYLVIWGVRVASGTAQAIAKQPHAIMTDDLRMLLNQLAH